MVCEYVDLGGNGKWRENPNEAKRGLNDLTHVSRIAALHKFHLRWTIWFEQVLVEHNVASESVRRMLVIRQMLFDFRKDLSAITDTLNPMSATELSYFRHD